MPPKLPKQLAKRLVDMGCSCVAELLVPCSTAVGWVSCAGPAAASRRVTGAATAGGASGLSEAIWGHGWGLGGGGPADSGCASASLDLGVLRIGFWECADASESELRRGSTGGKRLFCGPGGALAAALLKASLCCVPVYGIWRS